MPAAELLQGTRSEQPFIAALERMHAERVFAEPESRMAWFRQTSWTEADRYLTWANALSRELYYPDRLREPRQSTMVVFDYKEGVVSSFDDVSSNEVAYVAPAIHHRKPAMQYAFETAQQLPDLESAAALLRTAIFLTHRYSDGNTRLGAITDSLLTRGYDGSKADKDFYRTLTRGRTGIIENGIDIQTAFLGERFSAHALAKTVRQYGYDGVLPMRLTDHCMADLYEMRSDLEWREAARVNLQLAERHMGQLLVVKHLLRNGIRPDEHLEPDIHGNPLMPAGTIFEALSPIDLDDIMKEANSLKYSFVRSVIDCFKGDETIFGPYREVMARARAGGPSVNTSPDEQPDSGSVESVA